MTSRTNLVASFVVSVVFALTIPVSSQDRVVRQVAVTFDDLPVVSMTRQDLQSWRDITARLLAAIKAHHVPAIGFVNETKLGDPPDPARVALLEQWLDAGLELGNHSFSHRDLNQTPLAAFEDDVIRGERTTGELLKRRGRRLRFFRHPFLHTGETLEKKRAFETFLADRGYRVAPVTIDNDDYIFTNAYDLTQSRHDRALADRIAEAFVPYMEAKFAYFEQQSTALFGREIPQILLLHANTMNALRFDALAAMIERRGYQFVPIDTALTDPAYGSPDTYVESGGITWLHRWAMTRGVDRHTFFRGEPDVPGFVAAAAVRR
jgi:peptidoglycan/xylan/chitin deacetylase (PgdA/CDA1 family)